MNGESQSSSGDLNHPGTLIVFDGIDASGKSTQVRLLAETLRASGHLVIVSGEPTDSVWGQRLRRPGSRLPLSL